MLAAPHDLIDLIDPWRVPEPPHGAQRPARSSLQRAFRLRRWAQMRMDQFKLPATLVRRLLPHATLLALLLLGFWLQAPWLLIFFPIGLVAMWRTLPKGRDRLDYSYGGWEEWASEYRDMYYLLTIWPVPNLIASFEDVRSGQVDADDETPASRLLGGPTRDLPETLLRVARLREATLRGAEPPAPPRRIPQLFRPLVDWWRRHLPLGDRTRAHYCAAYDFFFQPQAAFHAALENLGDSTGE